MKRVRAGGYHVKTGCKTCKIRHVKCDEERPSCSKCRSTGRVCDGYKTKQSTSQSSQHDGAHLFPVDSTIKALSIIPQKTISITGTDRERRSFAFFCYQTGQQLSTAMDIAKTHQLVLQASHCDEAVRSAVIALGSIGERLSINNLLTLDNEQANACHQFAHLQYYRALKRLRERISRDSDGSVNLAVILCFLFTIFEFLQGNDAGCLIHLRSGLNILQRDHASLSSETLTMSPNCDPLIQELLRIFSILDMQATRWLGLETFQAPMMIPVQDPGDNPANSDIFATLDEASESLNYQIVSTHKLRRVAAIYSDSDSLVQMPPEVHANRDRLMLQMRKWPISLEILVEKLGADIDIELSRRIAVLKMNHKAALILLTASLQPSDHQVYVDYEHEFRRIIDLAKFIIKPTDDQVNVERIVVAHHRGNRGINPTPMFSFYAGVIQPLYLTAIKCQSLAICREAIELLSSSPWREGAWDSASMARIATRKLQEVEKGSIDTALSMMDGCGSRLCVEKTTAPDLRHSWRIK